MSTIWIYNTIAHNSWFLSVAPDACDTGGFSALRNKDNFGAPDLNWKSKEKLWDFTTLHSELISHSHPLYSSSGKLLSDS